MMLCPLFQTTILAFKLPPIAPCDGSTDAFPPIVAPTIKIYSPSFKADWTPLPEASATFASRDLNCETTELRDTPSADWREANPKINSGASSTIAVVRYRIPSLDI